MPELWAGADAGKAEHHCTVIDTDGKTVLSRRVPNNETERCFSAPQGRSLTNPANQCGHSTRLAR